MRALARCLVLVLMAVSVSAKEPAHALDPARSISQLFHSSWKMRDGIPAPIVAFAQSPDGFLWLGTESGLYRFDGVKAEPVGAGELPASSTIYSLATTTNGDVWAGFLDARLSRISNGKVTNWVVPTPGVKSPIVFVTPDPDGTIWVATIDAVFNFDGVHWRAISAPWPLAATRSDPGGVWGLALARDGTLWAKNLVGTYFLRRGASAFEQAKSYGGGDVDFARAPDGRLWTADLSTKRFYALPDIEPGRSVPPAEFGAAASPSVLGQVIMDRDGALWNANRITGGLRRLSTVTAPAAVEQFTEAQGLSSEKVITVFEDREGSIWVSTAQGLERFRHANVVVEDGLRIRSQAPALVATKDAVFAYTGMPTRVADPSDVGGRLVRMANGQALDLAAANIGRIEAIAASPAGDLIFAGGGGLMRWRDGVVTPIPIPADLEGGHVVNLVATSNGGLWVSLYGKGVYRWAFGKWTHIAPSPVSPNEAPDVALDDAGAAWLFYSDLVVRVAGDQMTEFRSVIPKIGRVRGALADRDGLIVVGGGGLARFDGSAFQFLLASRVPAFKLGGGIIETAQGDIWIHAEAGIVRIGRTALIKALAAPEAHVAFQVFDMSDGFTGSSPGDMFNSQMIVGPDGRIWFFMNPGVTAWIDPNHLYHNDLPPPVAIASVAEGGRRHELSENLTLPAGTSQFQINYTALSLAAPERVRFRYRLEGVDDGWVEAGDRRQAFYTNVEPGRYRFRVIAANNDGVWNTTGASVPITIVPTFLQSIWFKFLIALAFLGLAWLVYSLRIRQEASRLRDRFEVRIAERERIARELHDTLLQSIQGLILRFQSIANRTPADSSLRGPMHEAIDRADQILTEGRARVRELRSTAAADDLGRAIADVARDLNPGGTPRFALTVEGTPRMLDTRAGDEVLHIAEEAIRNALNHAKAHTIEAFLAYASSGLALTIRDDGVGMSESSLKDQKGQDHFGLLGMRERAESIGGRIKVSSRESGGTEILILVPGSAAYASRGAKQ